MTEPESTLAPPGYVPPGYVPPGYAPQAFPPPVAYFYPAPPPPPVAVGGAPLATPWERLAAYFIDAAVCLIAYAVPLLVFFVVVFGQMRSSFDTLRRLNNQSIQSGNVPDAWPVFRHLLLIELIGFAIVLPITMVISYLYYVTYMQRAGQTVGKRVMKITIVRASDGGPITTAQARKRWLVAQPAALLAPYFSYANSLWLLWDKPFQQCLHDKCADTVVVKIKP